MEKVCIDTDVLIELGRQKLIRRVCREQNIYLTVITMYEYLRGLAYLGRDVGRAKREIERRFNILYLDNRALVEASNLYSKLRSRGEAIPDPDLLIAAICISHNMQLATNNVEHYEKLKPYGLEIIKPNTVVKYIRMWYK